MIVGSAQVVFSNGMGVVDFCVNDDRCILYFTEAELVTDFCSKKIDKFHEFKTDDKLVIAIRNSMTSEAFSNLQKYAVIKLEMALLPVSSSSELPTLLSQLASMDSKSSNPFQSRAKTGEQESDIQLNLVAQIPSVGPKKAADLLKSFGNIRNIAAQSKDSLASVVGKNGAAKVLEYFNECK
ncbi:Fanconi anemia core complex-associated protein 24-like isoform X2 [Bacillus rossius redtenbacheri]|uniref:Fanconi anemia core complex-associated protein 24-like isoform X2 n=1 Tax=Bacillus rossius redtenbacheri TaxID=93214 RepID=UPI002FDDA5FC